MIKKEFIISYLFGGQKFRTPIQCYTHASARLAFMFKFRGQFDEVISII